MPLDVNTWWRKRQIVMALLAECYDNNGAKNLCNHAVFQGLLHPVMECKGFNCNWL